MSQEYLSILSFKKSFVIVWMLQILFPSVYKSLDVSTVNLKLEVRAPFGLHILFLGLEVVAHNLDVLDV